MERVTEWKIERRFLILKMDKKLPKINYEKLLVFYLQITERIQIRYLPKREKKSYVTSSVFLCVPLCHSV